MKEYLYDATCLLILQPISRPKIVLERLNPIFRNFFRKKIYFLFISSSRKGLNNAHEFDQIGVPGNRRPGVPGADLLEKI